ncbi:MAG: hypothetical protein ACLFWB_14040 [Armatimonadota bacterium]
MEILMDALKALYDDQPVTYAALTVLTIGISGVLFALLMKLMTRNTVLAEGHNGD